MGVQALPDIIQRPAKLVTKTIHMSLFWYH
jgi:hypothetical protein